MKRFVIIVFLLLVASGLKAQEKFIGLHRVPVMGTLQGYYKLLDTGYSKDGKLKFFHFKVSEVNEIYAYFDGKDICTTFVSLYNNKQAIVPAIESLNKKFKNIGSYEWVDNEAKVHVNLVINEDSFTELYRKL